VLGAVSANEEADRDARQVFWQLARDFLEIIVCVNDVLLWDMAVVALPPHLASFTRRMPALNF
jgi:hypothetical protein